MLERHRYTPLLAILTAVVLCALAQVGPFKPDPFTRSTVNDPYALESRQRAEIDYDPYEHARYACRETVRQSLDDPDALFDPLADYYANMEKSEANGKGIYLVEVQGARAKRLQCNASRSGELPHPLRRE